jgi:hypothetical protein
MIEVPAANSCFTSPAGSTSAARRPDHVANERGIVFAYIDLKSRHSLLLEPLAETVDGLTLRVDQCWSSKGIPVIYPETGKVSIEGAIPSPLWARPIGAIWDQI